MSNQQHALAGSLIGRPWREGASGPDAFNCWGLVRYYLHQAQGVDVGEIALVVESLSAEARTAGQPPAESSPDQVAAILAAARSGGWRRAAADDPQADDVAQLRHGVTGLRHVGVLLRMRGLLHLLHCEGEPSNPAPGVVCEPLADVLQRYHALELWRRT